MANKFLKSIYKEVFDKHFTYERFEDRFAMQEMVYLLQEMGVGIGEYGFEWYSCGHYIHKLC